MSRENRVVGRFRQGAVLSRSDASNVVRDERIVMGSAARSRTRDGAVSRIRIGRLTWRCLAVLAVVGGVFEVRRGRKHGATIAGAGQLVSRCWNVCGGAGQGFGRKNRWVAARGFAILRAMRRAVFSRRNLAGKNVRGRDSLGWKLILSKKTCFSIKNSFAFAPF